MTRAFWLRLLTTVLLPLVVAAVIVNLCAHDPDPKDAKAVIRSAWGADRPERVEEVYVVRIRACPTNLVWHSRRIFAHFEIPRMRGRDQYRDDATIVADYTAMAAATNALQRDIGWYCLGLIDASRNDYVGALAQYAIVSNRAMPHLNYSIGKAHMGKGDYHAAIPFLQREIAITGNVGYAYFYLAQCYAKTRQYGTLRALAKTPEAAPHMPFLEAKLVALLGGRIDQYLWLCVKGQFDDVTCLGLIAALIILAGWLMFLRRLDVFETERPYWLLAALGLGIVSAVLLSDVGYDTAFFIGNFQSTGRVLHDLFYCIFCIGLIEETVKIIPLLILLRWSRQVDETADYVIYASASALGFAFAENLLYFDFFSYTHFHGRAMTAVVLHMALSSIAAYGFVCARHNAAVHPTTRPWKRSWMPIAGFFVLAVVLHGVYDFWLVGKGWVEMFKIAALPTLLISVGLYKRIIANALNQSEFWTESARERVLHNGWVVTYLSTAIVIFEYGAVAWHFGRTAANDAFRTTLVGGLIIVQYLALGLGVIPLSRGVWTGLVRKKDWFERPLTKKELKFVKRPHRKWFPFGMDIVELPVRVLRVVRRPDRKWLPFSIIFSEVSRHENQNPETDSEPIEGA